MLSCGGTFEYFIRKWALGIRPAPVFPNCTSSSQSRLVWEIHSVYKEKSILGTPNKGHALRLEDFLNSLKN